MEAFFVSALTILGLILISAFFSAAETALTSVSRSKIHLLQKEGNRSAKKVSALREDKEQLIGTVLLGNNLVNILASAIATSIAIHYFGNHGVAYATVAMTLLILIFGEVLPKTYAFSRAEQVSLWIAPVMIVIVRILNPVIITIKYVVSTLLKLLGFKNSTDDVYGVDALRGAIDLTHHEGGVVKNARDMLGSILDLNTREVHEIMIHRKNMVMINADASLEEVLDHVIRSPHTRIPLWKDNQDNIVGILHAKALLRELRMRSRDLPSIDILAVASDPWFIPDSTLLIDQLTAFRIRRAHFALVVDEYGALMGMVTLEDILEEIVGEIDDETDKTSQGIWKQSDGSYKIYGSVTIRDLNRQLEWDLPDEHASTLAGLLIYEARSIPEQGESFVFYDYEFTVLRRSENQITLLKIKHIPQPDGDEEGDTSAHNS